MWEISSAVNVTARHQIRNVSGEGGRLHEHRWRVRAVIRAAALDATGWVLDFGVVAARLRELVAPYDGTFMNHVPPFDDINPTRENVARFLADALAAKLDDGRVHVHAVEIWEEDVCCATYIR
jgi:6-pyruvoyltetrahydropterin/6-carboxytetrahydropterin synthase